jgi:hypothetical protein
MVTPVILITVGAVITNSLLRTYNAVSARLFGLNREQLGILRGQRGEVLAEDDVQGIDRVRLEQIRYESPLIIRRVRRIRIAALIFACAVALLVASVIAIAVADTADSEAFAFTALALVIAGTTAELAGIVIMIRTLASADDTLMYEARRTDQIGLADGPCVALVHQSMCVQVGAIPVRQRAEGDDLSCQHGINPDTMLAWL